MLLFDFCSKLEISQNYGSTILLILLADYHLQPLGILQPLSLIYLMIRIPAPFHSFKVPSSLYPLIWTKMWPAFILFDLLTQALNLPNFHPILCNPLINLFGNLSYLSLNCVFIREELEPSAVLRIQLRVLHLQIKDFCFKVF